MSNIVFIGARKKSDPDVYMDPRAKHIRDWVEASDSSRKKQLGENFSKAAEDLYGMMDAMQPGPVFRPTVSIPMLQRIMLEEANQVSNLSPQIYVFSKNDRDKQREASLQAQWQIAKANLHLLMSGLTARYCGAGFIVAGFDPDLSNGRGGMWAKSIDPRHIFFDPGTDYTWEPSYAGYSTWMNLEEIRLKWPETGRSVKPRNSGNVQPFSGDAGYGIEQPPGPMSSMPSLSASQNAKGRASDSRCLVRHVFCKDYTREAVEKQDVPQASLIDPEIRLKYPNGRWLIECEGIILQDGESPYGMRRDIRSPRFPIFPLWVIPPVFGCWGIPVTRMTDNIQRLAQRFYSQIFENGLRMNNGVWFIDENTGIDIEAFGGIPGEAQVIKPGTRIPSVVNPNALGNGALQAAQQLLEVQNQVLGFTDSRQGNPGAGNISTDLFDSSVLQSSGLLQLAGRLLSDSVQMIGEFFFDTMCRFQQSSSLPYKSPDGMTLASWAGLTRPDLFDIVLDDSTIRPLSEAMIRKITPDLMKSGVVPPERGLRTLGYPDAEGISQERQQELALQALANVKKGKK